jgi:ankyrin repeat protein
MKHKNHMLSHQLLVYILTFIFFLQGCGGADPTATQPADNTEPSDKIVSIASTEGYLVTIFPGAHYLRAIVKENCSEGSNKFHNLPVHLENSIDITTLKDTINTKHIDVTLPTNESSGYVYVANTRLIEQDTIHDSDNAWYPLHLAAKNGYMSIVSLLIEKEEADINKEDKQGNTALHIAVLNRQVAIAKLLMQHGAAVNIACKDGWTPLYHATLTNQSKIVRLLIKYGANLNIKCEDGLTPLHVATINKQVEIVKLLIEHGADINVQCNDGWTVLHHVACEGYLELTKLLLAYGANINVKNGKGLTPMQVAIQNGYHELADLIAYYR